MNLFGSLSVLQHPQPTTFDVDGNSVTIYGFEALPYMDPDHAQNAFVKAWTDILTRLMNDQSTMGSSVIVYESVTALLLLIPTEALALVAWSDIFMELHERWRLGYWRWGFSFRIEDSSGREIGEGRLKYKWGHVSS